MTKNREFVSSCIVACAKRLPGWRKYGRRGLYRRTEDFVQWLHLEPSAFAARTVPQYAVQALAEQLPSVALTLGDRVRDRRGVEFWFEPGDWDTRSSEILESILEQIDPSGFEPLTPQAVIAFLERSGMDHVSAVATRGIAAIVAGSVDEGVHFLREAASWYGRMDIGWARQNEAVVRSWLSASPDDLLSVLRHDAEKGAELLHLK
ncbi:MAG: hypothetical protein M1132_04265 [Chloroflexi bacterium]|nr:hypothetical protein [Chloroflexota bacterium]